jgi:hypothetical protein
VIEAHPAARRSIHPQFDRARQQDALPAVIRGVTALREMNCQVFPGWKVWVVNQIAPKNALADRFHVRRRMGVSLGCPLGYRRRRCRLLHRGHQPDGLLPDALPVVTHRGGLRLPVIRRSGAGLIHQGGNPAIHHRDGP